MSGITTTLLHAMATDLVEGGVAVLREDGTVHEPGEVALTFGAMPPDPERVVCLTPYQAQSDPATGVTTLLVQSRCRAAGARGAFDLDDAICTRWQARWQPFGPVDITQTVRSTGPMPIGLDAAGRFEVVSTWAVTLARPETTQEY